MSSVVTSPLMVPRDSGDSVHGTNASAARKLQCIARIIYGVCVGISVQSGCGQSTRVEQRTLVALRKVPEYGVAELVSVAFSPDNKRLATGVGQLFVYNLNQPTKLEKRELGTYHIGAIAFSPDGRLLAVVCHSPDAQQFGADHVKLVDSASLDVVATLGQHTGEIHSLAFSPDGKSLATCGSTLSVASGWYRGELKLWDVKTGRVQHSVDRPDDTFASVAYSHSGKTFITGGGHHLFLSESGEITIWDSTTCQQVRTRKVMGGLVRSVVFFPRDDLLASGSDDARVKLWDALTLDSIYAYDASSGDGHRCAVQSIDVSRDGTTIGVAVGYWIKGGGWGELRLLDVRTRAIRASPIRAYPVPVTSVAFSSDGRLLAAACGDGTVRTWDLAAVSRGD